LFCLTSAVPSQASSRVGQLHSLINSNHSRPRRIARPLITIRFSPDAASQCLLLTLTHSMVLHRSTALVLAQLMSASTPVRLTRAANPLQSLSVTCLLVHQRRAWRLCAGGRTQLQRVGSSLLRSVQRGLSVSATSRLFNTWGFL